LRELRRRSPTPNGATGNSLTPPTSHVWSLFLAHPPMFRASTVTIVTHACFPIPSRYTKISWEPPPPQTPTGPIWTIAPKRSSLLHLFGTSPIGGKVFFCRLTPRLRPLLMPTSPDCKGFSFEASDPPPTLFQINGRTHFPIFNFHCRRKYRLHPSYCSVRK